MHRATLIVAIMLGACSTSLGQEPFRLVELDGWSVLVKATRSGWSAARRASTLGSMAAMANFLGFSRDDRESVVSSYFWGWTVIGAYPPDDDDLARSILKTSIQEGDDWAIGKYGPTAGLRIMNATGQRIHGPNDELSLKKWSVLECNRREYRQDADVAVWPAQLDGAVLSLVLLPTRAYMVGLRTDPRESDGQPDWSDSITAGMVVLAHTKVPMQHVRVEPGSPGVVYWQKNLEREPRIVEKFGRYEKNFKMDLATLLAGFTALSGIERADLAVGQTLRLDGTWTVERCPEGAHLAKAGADEAHAIATDRWISIGSDGKPAMSLGAGGMIARHCGRFVVVIGLGSERLWQLDCSP